MAEGVRFMSVYPPPPVRSRYIRRGKLRQSWSFQVVTGNQRIEGRVGSNSNVAPYNRDVQGEKQKPLFERIGWRNVKDLMKMMAEGFSEKVQKAVGDVLK